MHVDHIGKFLHYIFEVLLQFRLANDLFSGFDGGRFTFDMGKDGCDLRDLGAHFGFQAGNFVVCLFHAETLVEFQMLFDVQLAIQILHADVMHVEVVARSHSANAVENIFRAAGARNRMYHDAGGRQDFAHTGGHSIGHLLGALEGEIAFQSNRNVGEKTVPCFAETDTLHFENAVHAADALEDLAAHTARRCVEQRVHSSTRQTPTHGNHYARHEEGGHRIGLAQPVDSITASHPDQRKADDHDSAGPDVRGKMR